MDSKVASVAPFVGRLWTDLAEIWWTFDHNQGQKYTKVSDKLIHMLTRILRAKYRNLNFKDDVCNVAPTVRRPDLHNFCQCSIKESRVNQIRSPLLSSPLHKNKIAVKSARGRNADNLKPRAAAAAAIPLITKIQ